METKKCSKCGLLKEVCEFHKCSKTKNGFRSKCKLCVNEYSKNYSKNNRKIRNEIQKKWRDENQEKIKNYRKKYYNENPDKFIKISVEYRKKNPEKVKKTLKKYYYNNLEYHKKRIKLWSEKNKEHRKKYQKLWKNTNKKNITEYKLNRYKNDPLYRLTINCRSRINSFLKTKNMTKNNKTFEIVGCEPKELKMYLEKQFKNGMTWKNRNEWHIDHIIPLSSAKTEKNVINLCHFTNLQPLWVKENLEKSNKILKT
jgi:hypothetical protein